jgi:Cys-tRNA(Pro)/Cys-tRNA(Cys) deacylase
MNDATAAISLLRKAKLNYSLHSYEHDGRSESYGGEAASALSVDPARLFKTLIVAVSGSSALACAVVPVSGKLNLKACAAVLGVKKLDMADPAKARRATGYVIGGISPIGQKSALPTVIDASVREFDSVYVSGGRRGLQVQLAPEDLIAVTKGTVADIAG